MFLPALSALSQRFEHPVDVICHGAWGDIVLRRSPHFGSAFTVDTTQDPPLWLSRNHRAAVQWLAEPQPEAIFVFEGVPKLERVLRHRVLKRVPIVRGTEFSFGATEHRIDRELRIANAERPGLPPRLPDSELSRRPELSVDREELDDARRWLATLDIQPDQAIHLIQIGNRRTMGGRLRPRRNPKHWSEDNWIALLKHMAIRQPDAAILLCGVPAEHASASALAESTQCHAVRSVADQLPLPRLFALSKIASTMVSLDTGPAHVAAACGLNCVVLFGVTDPAVFAPRGRGRSSRFKAMAWMTSNLSRSSKPGSGSPASRDSSRQYVLETAVFGQSERYHAIAVTRQTALFAHMARAG